MRKHACGGLLAGEKASAHLRAPFHLVGLPFNRIAVEAGVFLFFAFSVHSL